MTRRRLVLLSLAVAGAYAVAGKLGLLLAVVHPSATAVWAPTGIALAAFLRLGYAVWPCRLLGASIIVTGLSHTIADTLVSIGVDLGQVTSLGDLQSGMEEAERLLVADAAPAGRSERHTPR